MPNRIGNPFGFTPGTAVPRRRETVLDPAYSGTGPPAPMATTEPVRKSMADEGGNGKTDWLSMFIKLMPLLVGGLAGGKKGLQAGTQFGVGYMGQEEKNREGKERQRKEALAEAKQKEVERHAVEMERLTQAKLDAAEQASREKEEAAQAKADAKEKARVAEKNADLLKDLKLSGDAAGVNYTVNADPNDPQGLLTPRGRVDQKPGDMTPRARASISRLEREPPEKGPGFSNYEVRLNAQGKLQQFFWDGKGYNRPGRVFKDTESGKLEGLREEPGENVVNGPPVPPGGASADTTVGRKSLAVPPPKPPSAAGLTPEETSELATLKAEAQANGGALTPEKAARFNALRNKKLGK